MTALSQPAAVALSNNKRRRGQKMGKGQQEGRRGYGVGLGQTPHRLRAVPMVSGTSPGSAICSGRFAIFCCSALCVESTESRLLAGKRPGV